MSTPIKKIDPEQLNWVLNHGAQVVRGRRWLPMDVLMVATFGALALLGIAIEYSLFFTIAERLFGYDDASIVAPMFAAAGLMVAVGWHLYCTAYPMSPMARVMPHLAASSSFLFVFGCGALLSAIVLQNSGVLDAEIDFASIALDQLTLAPEATTLSRLDATWTPIARLAYSIGIGFLSLILLFAISHLLHRTAVSVQIMGDRLVQSRHAKRHLTQLNAAVIAYDRHADELKRLIQETPDTLVVETVDLLERIIASELDAPRTKLEKLEAEGQMPGDHQSILPGETGRHQAEALRGKLEAVANAMTRERLLKILSEEPA